MGPTEFIWLGCQIGEHPVSVSQDFSLGLQKFPREESSDSSTVFSQISIDVYSVWAVYSLPLLSHLSLFDHTVFIPVAGCYFMIYDKPGTSVIFSFQRALKFYSYCEIVHYNVSLRTLSALNLFIFASLIDALQWHTLSFNLHCFIISEVQPTTICIGTISFSPFMDCL